MSDLHVKFVLFYDDVVQDLVIDSVQ